MIDGVYLTTKSTHALQIKGRGWHVSQRRHVGQFLKSDYAKGWCWALTSSVRDSTFVLPLDFLVGEEEVR